MATFWFSEIDGAIVRLPGLMIVSADVTVLLPLESERHVPF